MIGRKFDTDKSSQRNNVTHQRHCHPYTLFYNSVFHSKRKAPLEIAELGILEGSSLLMWREYFTRAHIDGFDYDERLLQQFRERHDQTRIDLFPINVKIPGNVRQTFAEREKTYDLIIEDTTHEMEDQIRVVQEVWPYLKPGGMLVVEDIFKRYAETDYVTPILKTIGPEAHMYFVTLDHVNRVSTGGDNDKLLIIQKGWVPRIFRNTNKMTIITPCCRPTNLHALCHSIRFEYVDRWIIVYDGDKVPINPHQFQGIPGIEEYVYANSGLAGNAQRNYALQVMGEYPETLVYFLDDDNVIHPDLYWLLDVCDQGRMYTFGQEGGLDGGQVELHKIDSAMVLMDTALCRGLRWDVNKYDADGHFITDVYKQHREKHVFIKNALCYYNMLAK